MANFLEGTQLLISCLFVGGLTIHFKLLKFNNSQSHFFDLKGNLFNCKKISTLTKYCLKMNCWKKCMINKTGLQPVSWPVEQVPLQWGVGSGCQVLRCQGWADRHLIYWTGGAFGPARNPNILLPWTFVSSFHKCIPTIVWLIYLRLTHSYSSVHHS